LLGFLRAAYRLASNCPAGCRIETVLMLAANLAVGLAVIVIGLLLSRLFADRLSGSPFVRRLTRDLAGTNLAAAQGFLASLSRFETDDPGA
jgi:hypothetical protein